MENFGGKRSFKTGGMALYVTLAVAFLLIAVFLAMALFFKITDITVEGAQKYTVQEIIDASGVEADGSIFFLNVSEAEIAVKNELPYVDTVKITRQLPGTVSISVTESTAAAYFTAGGSQWIVDLNCRILEETSAVPTGLVEIRGIAPEEPKVGKSLDLGAGEVVRLRGLKDMLKISGEWETLGLTAWLDMTNLSAVTFEYNGYKVNIGGPEDLDHKFNILLNQVMAAHPDTGSGQSIIYNKDEDSLHYMG